MRFASVILLTFVAACASFAQDAARAPPPPPPADPLASGPGLYAIFDTSLGKITVHLLEASAPQTVANFVALANGEKQSATPDGKYLVKKRYFDGLTFHRVIPRFMVQTGDMNGTGATNCGVEPVPDEIDYELRFNMPGRLAMANLGQPNTAACQVFITVGPAQHLNGTFTIFGVVSEGQDVADKISEVPTDNEKPLTPVILNKVTIERREK